MSYADDMKKLRKYKKEKRQELNKKYPKGGKEFIKAVNDLRMLSMAKFKAMGTTPITVKTVEKKLKNEKKKPNIIKAKIELPTKKPNIVKPKKTEKKVETKKTEKTNTEKKNVRKKSIMEKKTKDVKMVTLKDGSKGTIAQRLAEIDKEKEMAKKDAKFKSPSETKKRSDYFAKLASSLKTKKVAGGGAMMKKKTKYMAKGGTYGTPTKKMKMKAGGATKKTKYMARGGAGMKKTKYMAKGGAAKRK